jgi:hypothetical protein
MTESEIIRELQSRWVSRDELCTMVGLKDAQMRVWMAGLNIKLQNLGMCVLSTASRKGYHIPSADNSDDVALCEVALAELKSKAIAIFERRKSIEGFLSSIQKDKQLSLF